MGWLSGGSTHVRDVEGLPNHVGGVFREPGKLSDGVKVDSIHRDNRVAFLHPVLREVRVIVDALVMGDNNKNGCGCVVQIVVSRSVAMRPHKIHTGTCTHKRMHPRVF